MKESRIFLIWYFSWGPDPVNLTCRREIQFCRSCSPPPTSVILKSTSPIRNSDSRNQYCIVCVFRGVWWAWLNRRGLPPPFLIFHWGYRWLYIRTRPWSWSPSHPFEPPMLKASVWSEAPYGIKDKAVLNSIG